MIKPASNLLPTTSTIPLPLQQIAFPALAPRAIMHNVMTEDVTVDAEEAVASLALIATAFADAGLGSLFLFMSLGLALVGVRISSLQYDIAL